MMLNIKLIIGQVSAHYNTEKVKVKISYRHILNKCKGYLLHEKIFGTIECSSNGYVSHVRHNFKAFFFCNTYFKEKPFVYPLPLLNNPSIGNFCYFLHPGNPSKLVMFML